MVSLSGCFMVQQSALVQSKQFYDPTTDARIRLYGPYGDSLIKHYSDESCEQWRNSAGAKAHHKINNGLPRKVKNLSAGIPSTSRSQSAMQDTGVVFRDSFKEYVVAANKPVVLDASNPIQTNTYSTSCRIAVSFVPKAGQDYEASYHEKNGQCTIQIYEIRPTDKNTLATTHLINQVKSCSKIGDKPY